LCNAIGCGVRSAKKGGNVSRLGWNNKGMYLELIQGEAYQIVDDKTSTRFKDCLLPWIGPRTTDGKFVPWLASQTDILTEDRE
jgi:hypothetical protein